MLHLGDVGCFFGTFSELGNMGVMGDVLNRLDVCESC